MNKIINPLTKFILLTELIETRKESLNLLVNGVSADHEVIKQLELKQQEIYNKLINEGLII